MFDAVAQRYDLTNDVLSLGQDRRWRQRGRSTPSTRGRASGSSTWPPAPARRASRSRTAARPWSRATSPSACSRSASRPSPHLPFTAGDGTRLPFADDTFDAVTISFGLRNIVDPLAGLREMLRVTRPGGRLVVCEFSHPTWAPFRTVYVEYLMRALPADRPRGLVLTGRLRLPRRVDPRLARPAGARGPDRRGRLAAAGVAQPLRRHRRPAPSDSSVTPRVGVTDGVTPTRRGHRLDRAHFRAHASEGQQQVEQLAAARREHVAALVAGRPPRPRVSSRSRSVSTLDERSPDAACSSRKVSPVSPRSSQTTRSAQRRPSRSSSSMTGLATSHLASVSEARMLACPACL